MKEYMEAEGTKLMVTEALRQAFDLDEEASEQCLAFIKGHQEILSEEEFFQYNKLEEYEVDGLSEFISEEGGYYISIKKSTIFLVCLYLQEKVPFLRTVEDMGEFFGLTPLKGAYVKLDASRGYLCIMLELARNRRRGADKSLLKKFKGECCNNQLKCRYNENGMCRCDKERVEEICEDLAEHAIIKKKGSKYYYVS